MICNLERWLELNEDSEGLNGESRLLMVVFKDIEGDAEW